MTHPGPAGDRLSLTPALDAGDADFIAGFVRRVGPVARIWPGQPAVPSPWVPCASGCCLVLASSRVGQESAGQWLRFLISEFLTHGHRVDGRVEVPGSLCRGSSLLIVEAGEVFEGEIECSPQSRMPATRAGSA